MEYIILFIIFLLAAAIVAKEIRKASKASCYGCSADCHKRLPDSMVSDNREETKKSVLFRCWEGGGRMNTDRQGSVHQLPNDEYRCEIDNYGAWHPESFEQVWPEKVEPNQISGLYWVGVSHPAGRRLNDQGRKLGL